MREVTALVLREIASLAASRVIWVFALACLAAGIAVALGSAGGRSALWLVFPLLLYLVPLLGLLSGVSAARGDLEEEGILQPRAPVAAVRLTVKWALWTALISLAALTWILPAVLRAGEHGHLLSLTLHAVAEASIFVALGLALGRWVRDSVTAHIGALLLGCLFLVGAGLVSWLAAQTDFFQERPALWTLGLMLHPVEALRVSLMFTLENLPVDPDRLPVLAVWWLGHSGLWYLILAAVWTVLALALGSLRRPLI